MKKLLVVVLAVFISTVAFAGGSKNNNPLESVTLGNDCVLVFADGIDEEQCTSVPSSPQSGQQFICEVLMVCSSDESDNDDS